MSTITTAGGRLQGKVCIVTGSSSGIGRAICLAYSKEGASLVCADLRPQAHSEIPEEVAVETHELIKHQCGRAIFVKTDVSAATEVENLIQQTVAEYGRLDVMVNNAGISLEAGKPPTAIHETSEEDWDLTMLINAKSVYLGCKYATTQMLRQKPHPSGDRGWLINMSSIFGLVGGRYNTCYAASKGAVSNLTRQVALDYADARIHCNAICPGYTETAIFVKTTKNLHALDYIRAKHPFRGIGRTSDIAGAAVFLASDDSS